MADSFSDHQAREHEYRMKELDIAFRSDSIRYVLQNSKLNEVTLSTEQVIEEAKKYYEFIKGDG